MISNLPRYAPLFPELAGRHRRNRLLMFGVFRPDADRDGEVIGWIAILVLAGAPRWWSPTPAWQQRCSMAPS